jgi:superfamily II DNA or RNA helicase
MALLQNTEAVSFDEVHLLASASFLTVSRRLVNAAWRFGFSGTPLARGDQRTVYLVGATGPVIYKIKPQVLIDNGVLSAPKIQFVPCIQRVNGFSWPDVYKGGISESAARNALLTQMVLKAEKPALLFIKEIAHGRAMLAKLRTAGLKADFVHGVKSSAERKQANKRLVHGDIDVLIASTIYDQGVDIPELRSIIIGCGGKSDIKSLQRLGRGMRIAEGKTEMELWDVLDQGNPWLENHAKQRRGIYISQGYQIVELATSFAA